MLWRKKNFKSFNHISNMPHVQHAMRKNMHSKIAQTRGFGKVPAIKKNAEAIGDEFHHAGVVSARGLVL